MKKLLASLLLAPLLALAQSLPSPSLNGANIQYPALGASGVTCTDGSKKLTTNCTATVPSAALSSVTGTGTVVLSTSPTLVSPTLGTPSGNASGMTVLPVSATTALSLGGMLGQVANARAFGAFGDFSHDDTAAIQACLNSGLPCYVPPQNATRSYTVSCLTIPAGGALIGAGKNSVTLSQKAASNCSLLTLADQTASNGVTVRDLAINGNASSQSVPSDAIHLDNTGALSTNIPRHRIRDVFISNVSGNCIYLGFQTRQTYVRAVDVYGCGVYGFQLSGADSQVDLITSGQSGQHGVYITGSAYTVTNAKLWFAGNGTSAYHGMYCSKCTDLTAIGVETQDNGGDGFHADGAGSQLVNNLRIQVRSDSDNGSAGSFSGVNLFKVNNAYIDAVVSTRTGGMGVPKNGINLATVTKSSFHVVSNGQSSFVVGGDWSGGNTIRIGGRDSVISTVSYAATITPSPMGYEVAQITLTGNATIANPSVGSGNVPVGLTMSLVFIQDATGGRTVTWGNLYKTAGTWTTTANTRTTITFRFDGTNWIQTSLATGLS